MPSPYFSLALGGWIPSVLTWDRTTGIFTRVDDRQLPSGQTSSPSSVRESSTAMRCTGIPVSLRARGGRGDRGRDPGTRIGLTGWLPELDVP